MNPESIEKEIKEIKLKILEKRKKGQRRLEEFQRLQKELNEGAALIIKWENQVEVLQKVLDS